MAGVESTSTLVVLPGKPEQSEATMKLQNVASCVLIVILFAANRRIRRRSAIFWLGCVEFPNSPSNEQITATKTYQFEKQYQQEWAESGIFTPDAPSADDGADSPKFYGTMAYPYMNGTLHAGHAFTASKIGQSISSVH